VPTRFTPEVTAVAPTETSLPARLDAEWCHLAASRAAAAALRRWGMVEPRLAGWSDLHQLRAAVHDRSDPERSDQILAALVRLAAVTGHDDRLAARTVLQLLAPGAIRLANAVAAGDRRGAEAAVFAELAIGIRTYPWQRRPRRVAANLLLDCRQRLTRQRRRTGAEVPVGLNREDPGARPGSAGPGCPAAGPPGSDGDLVEVSDLLRWARRQGVLDAVGSWLILASHVHDVPMITLARLYGRSRSTLFSYRAVAESRLRRALRPGPEGLGERLPDRREV
jgi:hypothetical protein